jgi:8-oxo-dGTP diphosphatase
MLDALRLEFIGPHAKMRPIGGVMRDLFPVVVHTLLFRRGAVLLLRRAHTGYLDGWYALPGGHLQRGESVIQCAIRECFEEIGIELDAAQLRPAAAMPYRSGDQQGIDFIFSCADVAAEPRLAEPERFDDLRWWPTDGLPPNTVPYVERAIAMARSGEWFVEFPDT